MTDEVRPDASADGRVAGGFDRRYDFYRHDGIRETLLSFLGSAPGSVLEVGCGTGHWLSVMAGRGRTTVGADRSSAMLVRARSVVPGAALVQALAEHLPWRTAAFDRIVCVNALHQFADRQRFFEEARRVLKPGGGLLTVGRDPHADRDESWVYDYFDDMREFDRARFARVRTLRGEMTRAGFAWAESIEADRIDVAFPAAEALADGCAGLVDRSFTSRLSSLGEDEVARGVERVRAAAEVCAQTGGELQLVTDVRLFATIGWLA